MIQKQRIRQALKLMAPQLKGDALTGLVWTPHALEWTTLRGRGNAAEASTPSRAVPAGTDAEPALPAEARQLPGRLALALAAEHALLRVADLPSTDPAELRGMAELQADRFAPFSTEHLLVSHEVLHTGDNVSRVLIAALPIETVDRYAAACRREGLEPFRVDLDLVAWWQGMAGQGPRVQPETGRVIHVRADPAAPALVLTQDGLPIALRTLPRGHDAANLNWAELPGEIDYTLTSVESEWGSVPGVRVRLWLNGGTAPAADDVERIQAVTGVVRVETADGAALPPVSTTVARRANDAGPTIDLAPAEWASSRDARASAMRFFLILGSVLAVWLLAALVLLGLGHFERYRLKVQTDLMNQVRPKADEVTQLQSKMRSLEVYADRQRSALEILREVTVALPPGVTLTSFTYRKGKNVALRGEAEQVEIIYDFFKNLQGCGLFSDIKPEGISARQSRGGTSRQEFRVSANLPEEAPR